MALQSSYSSIPINELQTLEWNVKDMGLSTPAATLTLKHLKVRRPIFVNLGRPGASTEYTASWDEEGIFWIQPVSPLQVYRSHIFFSTYR